MGEQLESLAERIAKVAHDLQEHQGSPAATFAHAVELACANVDGCDGASISVVRQREEIESVGSSSPMAAAADRLQYVTREGPCLDAIWNEQTTDSPDLAHDDRWPTWGPRVVEETQARSVLCFRLHTHGDTPGALNLYSRSQGAFDRGARDEGLAIAALVAIAVAAARQIDQLTAGLDTRTVIGQATGILMERFDIAGDAAFRVLARYSSTSNVKLRDVAAEVIRTRTLPDGSSDV